MRRSMILAGLVPCLGLLVMTGCGSNIKEGVPEKIDMTKDYSPAAKPMMFNPGDSSKAEAASKAAGGGGAAAADATTPTP